MQQLAAKTGLIIGSLNRRTKMPLKVIVSGLLVVAGLMTAPLAVGAADRSTPEQAKALAEKAATYLKDKGPDAALPAFNDRNGSFVGSSFFCVHPLGLSEWG
jgi:hypothetical protein